MVVLFVAFAACSSDGGKVTPDGISMADHAFTPETERVAVGETVTWVNDSDETHTVTAVEDSLPEGAAYFSSGEASSEDDANDDLGGELIAPGEKFEWTFEEPGTYRYYCIPHRSDGMEGTVVVE